MPPTVYLISGANRGIGLGLVSELVSRVDTIVFAGARSPSSATALHDLAHANPGKLHVLKLTSGDEADNAAAVKEIEEKAGRLDVVIANAGICSYFGAAERTPASAMREHYEVNVIGTLVLFQATIALLRSSSKSPKFLPMTSGVGLSAYANVKINLMAYGTSKAAENFLARRLHFEHEKDGLVCFAISPGPVQTDLGKGAVRGDPEEEAVGTPQFRPVADASPLLIKLVDEGTRDNYGGRVVHIDGTLRDF